jgi:RNA 3'-terminal phosphate cyclase (ATP)
LHLQPGVVRGGHFEFAVGSAGSSSLVFQTVLPALLRAPEPSTLLLEGGTHNPFAPPFEFLRDAFVPRVEEFGPSVGLTLERSGFYPAGGGRWRAEIAPGGKWHPRHWLKRGDRRGQALRAVVAGLSPSIAERECKVLLGALRWRETDAEVVELPAREGPGNVTLVTISHEQVTEVVSSFGERGVSAERVARAAAKQVRRYLSTDVAVGEHLADQLLLPMAMAGGGSMSTLSPSRHTLTNMAVIEAFLAVRFTLEKLGRDHFLIAVAPKEE